MRKLTAGLLIAVMIFLQIPFEVFANYQSHVTNLIPTYIPTTNGNYRINLSWTNPSRWSTVDDVDAIDGDEYHEPEDYKAQMLNATAGESTYQDLVSSTSDGNTTSCVVEEALTSGSIYQFRIMPYHYHTYKDGTTTKKEEAPYSGNGYDSILFMTDIEVEASGSGNTMTVTWDNPQYKGYDIFSGYRIYYQRGGSEVTSFNTYVDVNISDSSVVRTSDTTRSSVQRLTYDIVDSTFTQGEVYAIKVEPLYTGYEIRNIASDSSYASVTINSTAYKICFRYSSSKEYRTNDADVAIPLEVNEDGKNFLKLNWSGISNTSGDIEKIELYSGDAEDNIGTKIGTIYTPQAVYVTSWQIDRPTAVTYYQIRVYIEDKTTPIYSTIAVYDPNLVTITPNIPEIYIDVGDDGTSLDVYWDTFTRYPYNSNEEAFVRDDGTYVDTNVEYDVWVSDKLENLSDTYLPKILDSVTAVSLTMTEYDGVDIPVYKYNFYQYYEVSDSGEYTLKEMEKNKTYYIKLVATKPVENGNDLSCDPSYASKYIPTDEDVANPQTLSKPPLCILTDSDGKQMITTSTITIGWKTKWFEIYDEESDNWYSKALISDGALDFTEGDDDDAMDFSVYTDLDYFKTRLVANGLSQETVDALSIRQIDLSESDISYEMLVKKFDDINEDGGYEEYIEALMNTESDSDEWEDISPDISGIEASYEVTGLEENTAYVIILRPYRVLESGTKDAYPTYVMGTTAIDDTTLNITPTIPLLSEVDHDDHSFEVKWEEHIPNLDYELCVSETNLSDPSSAAIKISIDEIKLYGQEANEDGKLYMYYTVENLFPETGYYVWVRSIAPNDGEEIVSQWSNPLYIETSAMETPDPPDGLGLAASEHVKIYNRANSVNYIASDYDYLIVEWTKNYDDTEYTDTQGLSGTGWEALGDDQITGYYMVKFNDLTANTEYYVRAKTVAIIEPGESSSDATGGGAKRTFAYVVQLSLTKDFKDAVEAIVPISEIPEETSSADKIYISESEWSTTIRLYTEPSENEYDGDKDPDLYPLPTDDFEIIYDYGTMDLKYRFRSNQEDQDENDDNLVDQRLISRLIQNHTFTYSIDLTSYDSQTIKSRSVEMPYSIIAAFDERQIKLEVTANNVTFTLEPEFIKTADVKNLSGLGYGSTVTIKIEEKPSDSPSLAYNQTYLSIPQKISVKIETPTVTYNLENPANCMNVALKLSDRSAIIDSNVDSYYDSDATAQWGRITGSFDNASGCINVYTARFGTFCAISNAAPQPIGNADTSNISSLASRINITDITNYNPQSAVSSVQFNNLVAAVALGEKDVSLNKALTTEEYDALLKKNMLTDGSLITREQGTDILVKLYEAKTKQKFMPYSDINSTPYSDIASASDYYKANLIKAGDLGFFDNTSGARPKDIMSLDEFIYMMNIVLQDCNY